MIIEARDFAGKPNSGFNFGGGQVVLALKSLIAAIEAKRVAVQGVTITSTMSVDDFLMNEFTITYAEKVDTSAGSEVTFQADFSADEG